MTQQEYFNRRLVELVAGHLVDDNPEGAAFALVGGCKRLNLSVEGVTASVRALLFHNHGVAATKYYAALNAGRSMLKAAS